MPLLHIVRNQPEGSSVKALTVQAWLGHGSIQITARYLHHLGDFADRAALDVLNNAASTALIKRAKMRPGSAASALGLRVAPLPIASLVSAGDLCIPRADCALSVGVIAG